MVKVAEPRRFTTADDFETSTPADWPVHADAAPADVGGAWLQYQLARTLWHRIRDGALTLEDLAHYTGKHVETQRRKLQGALAASPRDLAAWTALAGPSESDNVELLTPFPPSYASLLGSWQPGRALPAFRDRETFRPGWPELIGELARRFGDVRITGAAALLTASVARHLLAQALLDAGVDSERLSVTDEEDVLHVQGRPATAFHTYAGRWSLIDDGRSDTLDAAGREFGSLLSRVAAAAPGNREQVLILVATARLLRSLDSLAPRVSTVRPRETVSVGPIEKASTPLSGVTLDLEVLARQGDQAICLLLSVGKPTWL